MKWLRSVVAVSAGLICWPAAAQMDEKPPVLKRGDSTPQRTSGKAKDSDSKSKDSDIIEATGKVRQIDEKTIQVEADDTRLLTCNLTHATVVTGPSGKLTTDDLEPGMRVAIRAKFSEDKEQLSALSVELNNPTTMPKDLKTATVQDGPPDEEGRPILRRGKPPKKNTEDTSDEDSTEAKTSPAVAPAPVDAGKSAEPAAAPRKETLESITGGSTTGKVLIEKARQATAEFSGHLPNFVCQQFTTRYTRESRVSGWRAEDVITATVVYQDGKEDYQNIKVGNRSSAKGMMDMKGQRSIGEFGGVLDGLMDRATDADFRFTENVELKHVRTAVYDFAVKRERSDWKIMVGGEAIIPAYSGRVWVDRETGRVLRLERQADQIPESFPNDTVEQTVDYDFVTIGSRKRLLPTESQNLSCERGTSFCGKNVIEFRNYKEFRGEATVEFDK